MKQIRTFHKIIALVALITMVFSLAACGNNKGSLKLESFTVDRTSIKTSYLVGEEIDFSGIRATVKYSDESLNKVYTYSELTISYADDITATVGEKDVFVSFQDPNLNVKQETKVTITVSEELAADGITYPALAVQFERPANIVNFNSNNTSAGKTAYGEAGFASEFYEGGKTYVVGNENEFKFNPQFSLMLNSGEIKEQTSFYTSVEVSIYADGAYSALTATKGEGDLVSFGEYLTVDTYKGTYQFSDKAAGNTFKISVNPSKDYYIYEDLNTITLEVYVVKAYNVYEAWQLAVIDNDTTRDDWDEIKTANGIKDLTVSGVVLHNDIKITANDVPQSFLLTSTKDVVYTSNVNDEIKTVTVPAGTKFLEEWTEVYFRKGAEDFIFEGNFCTIDLSGFPLVPSVSVFGAEADLDYGSDFSNSTLFKFETVEDYNAEKPEKVAHVAFSNIAFKGNSPRDNYVDADGELASAGGLIFVKATHHTEMTANNIIGNAFFIAYFPESGSSLTMSKVKCYDSYQNAAMVWADTTMTVNDSVFEGCGGPAIIAQSVTDDGRHPNTIINNSILSTYLSGEELWFSAVNATTIVGGIKALGAGLGQTGFGSFVDKNNMLNVQALLMASSDDAGAAVVDVTAQGLLMANGNGLNRYQTDALWQAILTHPALAAGAPFLSVIGEDGNPYVLYFDGTTFCDIYGRALGTDASHAYYQAAFAASDTVVLTQGGLSVILELYHE